MTGIEEAARQALQRRLGTGARYDASAAPSGELVLARLGTAYFARQLNALRADDLDRPSLRPGWSRRHVIAHVGFHARGLARLVEAARLGRSHETLDEPEAQNEDVSLGATLPDHALRHLFDHSAVHLNVEWRDLDATGWNADVCSLAGPVVPVAETPWLRAREVWLSAVDLDDGASFLDFPPGLVDRLLAEILAEIAGVVAVERDDLSLDIRPVDRADVIVIGAGERRVSGRAADLLRWLSGRGAHRLIGPGSAEWVPPLWPR